MEAVALATQETSLSWLETLRNGKDDEAWRQLDVVYRPFLERMLTCHGIDGPDRDDAIQAVMMVVVRRVAEFDRARSGSFRKWLRTITGNVLRDHWRHQAKHRSIQGSTAQQLTEQLADPESDLSRHWEMEHDRYVLAYFFRKIRDEFQGATWRAFELAAIENLPAKEIAEELGMTENAVYIARSRVMRRLRHFAADILD